MKVVFVDGELRGREEDHGGIFLGCTILAPYSPRPRIEFQTEELLSLNIRYAVYTVSEVVGKTAYAEFSHVVHQKS